MTAIAVREKRRKADQRNRIILGIVLGIASGVCFILWRASAIVPGVILALFSLACLETTTRSLLTGIAGICGLCICLILSPIYIGVAILVRFFRSGPTEQYYSFDWKEPEGEDFGFSLEGSNFAIAAMPLIVDYLQKHECEVENQQTDERDGASISFRFRKRLFRLTTECRCKSRGEFEACLTLIEGRRRFTTVHQAAGQITQSALSAISGIGEVCPCRHPNRLAYVTFSVSDDNCAETEVFTTKWRQLCGVGLALLGSMRKDGCYIVSVWSTGPGAGKIDFEHDTVWPPSPDRESEIPSAFTISFDHDGYHSTNLTLSRSPINERAWTAELDNYDWPLKKKPQDPAMMAIVHTAITSIPNVNNVKWHSQTNYELGREDLGTRDPVETASISA